ncbi:hypothetical protein SMKI_11G2370 [Saccharomyces mikatae IFO 1815]|uniref:Uncharacterized protein n=1 Tax=Saccharomyces mikatae IFO 1815 TaxID=226126 RepID=A0AA35NCV3_SACMI|nr:uncharacterized protein SMKI_11G2370 [Saccharomyces mikatae IFO 1815]CAI4034787.1 hypothetical protein SMKI_11G2370 [Saccharomyces mikatae IFO 1815]
MSVPHSKDQSLLDDASTLLLFSKGKNRPEEASKKDSKADTIEHDECHESEKMGAIAMTAAASVPLPPKKSTEQSMTAATVTTTTKEEHTEKQPPWPVPDSYIVDPDAGIITCICDLNDDDGFTIQCDHCNRWQHAICYGIKDIEMAPDDYLCNSCDPRTVDIDLARQIQRERLGVKTVYPSMSSNGSSNKNNSRDRAPSISNSDGGESLSADRENSNHKDKRRKKTPSNNRAESKNESASASSFETLVTTQKKKEHFLSAKDAYGAIYLPLKKYVFKDELMELFLDKHKDDDCIIQYPHKTFKAMSIEVKPYADIAYSRTYPGFTKLGVYLKRDCVKGDFIQEILGDLDFRSNYLTDPRNQYRVWGTAKRRVIFHSHWPIYIDARLSGNSTRYLRRSCQPNVELVTIKLQDAENTNDKNNKIKFVLRALRGISENEELYIKWQWDSRHPILKLIGDTTIDSLTDLEKYGLINSIETILSNGECGCGNNSKDCYLLKVKRYSQSLYKSVKSRAKMSNRYKLNEILNQYEHKKRREPPILHRLEEKAVTAIEKAPIILNTFHQRKFLDRTDGTKSSRKDSITGAYEDQGIVKPFKFNLFTQYSSNVPVPKNIEAREKPLIIKKSSDYDESHITNIKELPIPVPLPVSKTSWQTVTDFNNVQSKNEHIARTLSLPNSNKELLEEKEQNQNKTGEITTEALTNSKQELSPESIMHLSDFSSSQLHSKKKLSFADYKKKLLK